MHKILLFLIPRVHGDPAMHTGSMTFGSGKNFHIFFFVHDFPTVRTGARLNGYDAGVPAVPKGEWHPSFLMQGQLFVILKNCCLVSVMKFIGYLFQAFKDMMYM